MIITEISSEILDSLANPQQRHAMLVHLPIAMSVLAIPFGLAVAAVGGRAAIAVRWLAVAVFLFAATTAWITVESGESALHSSTAGSVELSNEAQETLHDHEELAEKIPFLFLGLAVLCALTGLRSRGLRLVFKTATILASVATTGWVAGTAHEGGLLVYEHGLGVPTTESNLPDKETPTTAPGSPGIPGPGNINATQPGVGEPVLESVPKVKPRG